MKKHLVAAGFLALGMAFCVLAQSDADYQGLMKDMAATSAKARKAIMEKNGADLALQADRLEGVFKQAGAFWAKRRGADDAVEIARKGETAAHDLGAAAKAKDAGKMASSMQTINQTCVGCHMAHRDGTAGAYTIK